MSPKIDRNKEKKVILPVITIDGLAGVGKHTVAKKMHKTHHLLYLNFDRMREHLAKTALHQSVALTDTDQLVALTLEITESDVVRASNRSKPLDPSVQTFSDALKEDEDVYLALGCRIRDIAQDALPHHKLIVVTGRSAGSELFPDAVVKIGLDAGTRTCAHRVLYRDNTLSTTTQSKLAFDRALDLSIIQITDLNFADFRRSFGAFKQVPDRVMIDTNKQNPGETVAAIKKIILAAQNLATETRPKAAFAFISRSRAAKPVSVDKTATPS